MTVYMKIHIEILTKNRNENEGKEGGKERKKFPKNVIPLLLV